MYGTLLISLLKLLCTVLLWWILLLTIGHLKPIASFLGMGHPKRRGDRYVLYYLDGTPEDWWRTSRRWTARRCTVAEEKSIRWCVCMWEKKMWRGWVDGWMVEVWPFLRRCGWVELNFYENLSKYSNRFQFWWLISQIAFLFRLDSWGFLFLFFCFLKYILWMSTVAQTFACLAEM